MPSAASKRPLVQPQRFGATMDVRDGLYGAFEIDGRLRNLVMTPEVRRLSHIHLVNTPSPSLASLGDVRRFSHTLGVLYLCGLNQNRSFREEEWLALKASVLLHDIGTPPFGHLLEYHLRESVKSGWSHEAMIGHVLGGFHAPENRSHQIFAKRTIRFQGELKKSAINLTLVRAIVNGKHPLASLLFGSIDLDNIDNVVRMAWALGFHGTGEIACALARAISVNSKGELLLSEDLGRPPLSVWAKLRSEVYRILLFDPIAVASQAVLSEAVGRLITKMTLDKDDWYITDDQLMEMLLNDPETKDLMMRDFFGEPPFAAFLIHLACTLADLGLANRNEAKKIVEDVLRETFPRSSPLGYVILDKGTFEKQLQFRDPNEGHLWLTGTASSSVIIYGFLRSESRVPYEKCMAAGRKLLRRLSAPADCVIKFEVCSSRTQSNDQLTINFTP